MGIEALVPSVRRKLGVSSSYDSEEIPDIIRGSIGRLLRDYNFPKSIRRAYLGSGAVDGDGNATLAAGDQTFELPTGFKREFQLRFYDPADGTWSEPLSKREGFRLPAAGVVETGWYWFEGTALWIDLAIEDDGAGKQLVLIYQSMLLDEISEAWISTEWPDAVTYLSVMRGALDFRKPDVAKDYAALWTDEQTSLAIYLNELEWGNVVMMQRERAIPTLERYPVS
jgi:hypothetical protein